MHMFERENKEPIFVTPSKKIATTLESEEMNETIKKLFSQIDEEKPQFKGAWKIKIKNYEIYGVFIKKDKSVPTIPSDTLKIMFESEYRDGTFNIQ